jgi:hypothetical protein
MAIRALRAARGRTGRENDGDDETGESSAIWVTGRGGAIGRGMGGNPEKSDASRDKRVGQD